MSAEHGGIDEKQVAQAPERAATESTSPENGSAILEHIKCYLNEKRRDYAIAISGNWGCGKTYFIRNVLTKERFLLPENTKEHYRFVYLSLFGLKYDEAVKALAVKLCYRSGWYTSLLANTVNYLRWCAKYIVWVAISVVLFLLIALNYWGWWGLSLLVFPVALFSIRWSG